MDIRFEHNLRTRQYFFDFLDQLSAEELNKISEGFSNNILWNTIHVMVSQQALLYALSGLDQGVPKELSLLYRNGTTPEEFVDAAKIQVYKEMLLPLLHKTIEDYNAGLFVNFKEYTTSTGYVLRDIDEAINLNNIHEGIHLGYCLALKKAL
ncbi:MAG: DinB family protein [Nonlabens sp.]|uniref:DinB family protein n=1 Tax=Nonlabens sp. TaxID=1888209 RepID=UPI003EF2E9DA